MTTEYFNLKYFILGLRICQTKKSLDKIFDCSETFTSSYWQKLLPMCVVVNVCYAQSCIVWCWLKWFLSFIFLVNCFVDFSKISGICSSASREKKRAVCKFRYIFGLDIATSSAALVGRVNYNVYLDMPFKRTPYGRFQTYTKVERIVKMYPLSNFNLYQQMVNLFHPFPLTFSPLNIIKQVSDVHVT